MKIDYSPKGYNYLLPVLEGGKPTQRVYQAANTLLDACGIVAVIDAQVSNNPVTTYVIENVYLVGSGATGTDSSDVDLLLDMPAVDQDTAKRLKTTLSIMLFTDRDKREAIDPFIGKPNGGPLLSLTDMISSSLHSYNTKLK